MRTHRIIIATLLFAVATSTNAATVTSFTIFSADSSGARAFGQAWNTQGGDGVWATGIIHESPGPINNPDTSVNIDMSGVDNISLHTSQNPHFAPGNLFGLNIFFDFLGTPGISAIGQVGTSTLISNSSPSTWGLTGFSPVSGSGSLSYTGLGGEIVTLTALHIPLFNIFGADFVRTGESPSSLTPDGLADGVINITLSTSAVPVPAAVWLFGTALIGLVGLSKRRKAA